MLPKIEPETIQTHPDAQRADAAYDEFERRFAELTERAHQRALAAARKAGFSSVEEYREATDKETARLAACARKRIEKETGKSWEQFWATHPQRERTPPKSFPRCNCDYHPIPMFCANSLVDYRTQDAPELLGFFQARGDQDLAILQIDLNSRSKRLSPEILEEYWQRSTQDVSSEWPPWLQQDPVLRRIKEQGTRDDSQERLEAFRRCWEGTVSPSPSRSVFNQERGDVEMPDAAGLPTPNSSPLSEETLQIKTGNQPEIQEWNADSSRAQIKKSDDNQAAPQLPKPKHKTRKERRSQLTRPSKVTKNATVAKKYRGKDIGETTRRARSQNTTKFYELDPNGSARTYRGHG